METALIVPPKGREGEMIILKRYILKKKAKRAAKRESERRSGNVH